MQKTSKMSGFQKRKQRGAWGGCLFSGQRNNDEHISSSKRQKRTHRGISFGFLALYTLFLRIVRCRIEGFGDCFLFFFVVDDGALFAVDTAANAGGIFVLSVSAAAAAGAAATGCFCARWVVRAAFVVPIGEDFFLRLLDFFLTFLFSSSKSLVPDNVFFRSFFAAFFFEEADVGGGCFKIFLGPPPPTRPARPPGDMMVVEKIWIPHLVRLFVSLVFRSKAVKDSGGSVGLLVEPLGESEREEYA